jgi:hypothetical protein
MAVKIQYPLLLHGETKCPNCNQPIVAIAPGVYTCHGGHILEPYVLVTLKAKPPQQPVKASPVPEQVEDKNQEQGPLMPDYGGVLKQ